MTIIGTGAIGGPIVSGILITEFGWRSIFFAAIPVAIIAFLSGFFIDLRLVNYLIIVNYS